MLEVLRNAGLEIDHVELLDSLYLARMLTRDATAPLALLHALDESVPPGPTPHARTPVGDDSPAGRRPSVNTLPRHHGTLPPLFPQGRSSPRHIVREDFPAEPDTGERSVPVTGSRRPDGPQDTAVLLPGPRALGSEIALDRALRPLKRRVPSTVRTELDEEATAVTQAETRRPQVVLRPARERWFRLLLVIDSEASMLLWQRHCDELRATFERSGAFRQIQVHQFSYGSPRSVHKGLALTRPWDGNALLHAPGSLADPSGRSMVVVVTDGAAPAWRDGRMAAVLRQWAAVGPVAVINVLPRHLWAGTGAAGDTWHLTASRPGAPNASLNVTDPLLLPLTAPFDEVPEPTVPIVELTPGGLAAWAEGIVTVGHVVPMCLWEPQAGPAPGSGYTLPWRGAGSKNSVRAFSRSASPGAVRLAAHLAAVAPVTVPVMELVQEGLSDRILGRSALAEVFLSGLLTPLDPEQQRARTNRSVTSMRHRLFDFTADAKDLLLDSVPTAELIRCRNRVGRRIEQLAGRSPDFPAWLLDPSDDDQQSTLQPFASLGQAFLARLGIGPVADDVSGDREDDDETRAYHREPMNWSDRGTATTAVIVTNDPRIRDAVSVALAEPERLPPGAGVQAVRGRLPGTAWQQVVLVSATGADPMSDGGVAQVVSRMRVQVLLVVGTGRALDAVVAEDVVVSTRLVSGWMPSAESSAPSPAAWLPDGELESVARRTLGDTAHFGPVVLYDGSATRGLHHGVDFNVEGAVASMAVNDITPWLRQGHFLAVVGAAMWEQPTGPSGRYANPDLARRVAAAALDILGALEPDPSASANDPTSRYEEIPAVLTSTVALPADEPGLPLDTLLRPVVEPMDQAEVDQVLTALEPTQTVPEHVTVLVGPDPDELVTTAEYAARTAGRQGWFDGGTVSLDLRGYDDTPATADLLRQILLRELGQPAVGSTPEQRLDHYRKTLRRRARVTGRTLVLLTNVTSYRQVQALRSGAEWHQFLVIARDKVPYLPASRLTPGRLSSAEAEAFLDARLREADPDDGRIELQSLKSRELAELCDQRPVALRVAAALLVAEPDLNVRRLVDRVRASPHQNVPGLSRDGTSGVFALAVRSLGSRTVGLLRTLVFMPGPGTDVATMMVAIGADEAPLQGLAELERAGLVVRVSDGSRWYVPRSVREYVDVSTQGSAFDEEAARAARRLLDHYLALVMDLNGRLRGPEELGAATTSDSVREAGMRVLDEERTSLLAAAHWGYGRSQPVVAARLGVALGEYLRLRRLVDDWVTVSQAARRMAASAGDRMLEAAALNNLGPALHAAGRVREARSALELACETYEGAARHADLGRALHNLGVVLTATGDADEAVTVLERAFDMCEEAGFPAGVRVVAGSLGSALRAVERTEEAATAYEVARDLHQAVGDADAEAGVHNNLGILRAGEGRLPDAALSFTRALDLFTRSGNSYDEARTARNLARLHQAEGRLSSASTAWGRAAEALTRAGAAPEAEAATFEGARTVGESSIP
ncbi:tetratricopeptide repeat protein [Streptomyces sp. W16]|uniref:tetratricopeptide repeat protein n=1 Tax=Streptomyces sp. W16 TaxID=3076631 RepID=UPI00295AB946|nr:tetratricopeptide repeat protein [Streptomyces sp. W16]MDV9171651.1 tetratricopeptide repeat protein [Streptomyces sp. W16]